MTVELGRIIQGREGRPKGTPAAALGRRDASDSGSASSSDLQGQRRTGASVRDSITPARSYPPSSAFGLNAPDPMGALLERRIGPGLSTEMGAAAVGAATRRQPSRRRPEEPPGAVARPAVNRARMTLALSVGPAAR